MKKLALLLCFAYTTNNFSYIIYNSVKKAFCSHSNSDNIDLAQYNNQLATIWHHIASHPDDMNSKKVVNNIITYLKILNTPTSLQLLEDIKYEELYPAHIFYAFYWAFNDAKISRGDKTKEKDALKKFGWTEKDIKDYDDLLVQVGFMIISCWNCNMHGNQTQDQLVSFLKKRRVSGKRGTARGASHILENLLYTE